MKQSFCIMSTFIGDTLSTFADNTHILLLKLPNSGLTHVMDVFLDYVVSTFNQAIDAAFCFVF